MENVFFATRNIKEVGEFLIPYFLMVTNLNDYVTDSEGIKKEFRVRMEGQFEHDLYYKSLSNQLESDETDTSQQRIEWWMTVVDSGGPIPNNVYDYRFDELFNMHRKAIDPEMQEIVKELRDRQIIP